MKQTVSVLVAILVLALAAPAGKTAEKKAPPWEKPLETGLFIYRENCIVCHEIDEAETRKLGPSLFRFFQNEKTPKTGIEPSEQYFRVKVQVGGDIMPAFQNKLTAREMNLLVEFVRSKK